LRSPLIWTDDLAQAVFLWLGMIGATVALNRGEHMRMTALIVRAPPGLRRGLEAFAAAAGLLFLAAVIQPAIEYVQEVARIEIPGLGISKAWLTMPLPCGCFDDHRRRHQAVPRLPDRHVKLTPHDVAVRRLPTQIRRSMPTRAL